MTRKEVTVAGVPVPVYSLNTLIVGSGAAALNAAVCLHAHGVGDIAVVTDRWGGGTSNNAGSDKQTYYKISLAGELPDSALRMAVDLFTGGAMHGDIAFVEAQNSARAFLHLVELGVPFPHDRWGAYVGYKTDNDPRQRATSAGPLTSRLMFEALAREVERKKIPVLDGHEVIALLTLGTGDEKRTVGAVALDHRRLGRESRGFVLFNAVNVVFGTGGPAGIHKHSVYPESQVGSHGLAFAAGAVGQNLTESQFGLASLKFRWNLSGSYQQVIPRYFSTTPGGRGEREFLNEHFPDMRRLATAIFLKGYQWPFDPSRISDCGSSLIDLLVYRETHDKGRRVFLDFRRNPRGGGGLDEFSLDHLDPEARSYLEKSGALLPIPIQRLARMNRPAISIFKEHGLDLMREPLEIGLCVQHNNGGLKGNVWWESNIRHLFPVGEVNGSHGVRRPGGSALNSGQVGGLRAAFYISRRYAGPPVAVKDFLNQAGPQVEKALASASRMLHKKPRRVGLMGKARGEIQERMSAVGAAIRDPEKVRSAVRDAWALHKRLGEELGIRGPQELPAAFKILDLAMTHALYLEAILEYLNRGGKSRGSYIVLDKSGQSPGPRLEEKWRFSLNPPRSFVDQKILEIALNEDGGVVKNWVDVRPLPRPDGWFENVSNDFREGRTAGEEE